MPESKIHRGGCHCGKVRFEAVGDMSKIIACNCSICAKNGLWLTFVAAAAFKLISGESALKDYQFASKKIHHLFCADCGVESFGRGSAADGSEMVAVNVRCLDGIDIAELEPEPFDGKSL